ncbi:hypothetical protein AA309_17460 [Microvirga vignae]|uniref:Uncharacterized protein n=1 Tax=Microvirga vignae TaxID=1225564 RepID=A0A0H1R9N7_9HYPH|nr:hypothetical protein AA309_17460 [Microvirga vignae]
MLVTFRKPVSHEHTYRIGVRAILGVRLTIVASVPAKLSVTGRIVGIASVPVHFGQRQHLTTEIVHAAQTRLPHEQQRFGRALTLLVIILLVSNPSALKSRVCKAFGSVNRAEKILLVRLELQRLSMLQREKAISLLLATLPLPVDLPC